MAASKSAAKDPMIAAAGMKSKNPFSIPRPYIVHKIVSAVKVPPTGIPPSKNESAKAVTEMKSSEES